jgi:hypothetical protein
LNTAVCIDQRNRRDRHLKMRAASSVMLSNAFSWRSIEHRIAPQLFERSSSLGGSGEPIVRGIFQCYSAFDLLFGWAFASVSIPMLNIRTLLVTNGGKLQRESSKTCGGGGEPSFAERAWIAASNSPAS